LFLAALEKAYADIRSAERELELETVDPIDSIRRLVNFTWDYYRENPEFLALLNNENLHKAVHIKRSKRIQSLHSPFVEMLRRIIEKGEEDGFFRSGVDPVQLYMSIAGVSYFYFSNASTLSVVFGRDLMAEEALVERREHVVEVILGYLRI
jgi:AcrR family transcriptional regulator